jgi:hypothetical protein
LHRLFSSLMGWCSFCVGWKPASNHHERNPLHVVVA